MRVGAIGTRAPETTSRLDTVRRVARQMAAHDVGAVIVTDAVGHPEGIVTDRDIVVRCLAEGHRPEETTVDDVMSPALTTVHQDARVEIGLEMMANAAVRRLVVVDDADCVVGIVTLDDMLGGIVEQTEEVGRLLHRQVHV